MNPINLYDFDGTIYDGNSSVDFFVFCLLRNPRITKHAVRNLSDVCKISLRLLNLEDSNGEYCSFLSELNDLDSLVELFWDKNQGKVQKWYLNQKEESDIVITGSPEFIIKPICEKLHISGIGTLVDIETGKITDLCYKKNKLKRLEPILSNQQVNAFYTDDVEADCHLFPIANHVYKVKRGKVYQLR